MKLEIAIYLINTLTSVKGLILIGSVIATILLFACWLANHLAEDVGKKKKKRIQKKLQIWIILPLTTLFFTCFIPSKETMYTMLGISTVKTVAATPEAQKALKILNLGLDKAIDKLQESK